MNEALRMQISAFVDGELPENESELLLRRLSQDADMRQQVADYLDIGRAIRRDIDIPNMNLLRTRIAESLGDEVIAETALTSQARNRFARPLAGFAVAASVAILALVGLRMVGAPDSVDVESTAQTDDRLAEMYRRHENSSWGTGGSVSLVDWNIANIEESGLVVVEPRAQLVPATEIQSAVQSTIDDEANAEDSVNSSPE